MFVCSWQLFIHQQIHSRLHAVHYTPSLSQSEEIHTNLFQLVKLFYNLKWKIKRVKYIFYETWKILKHCNFPITISNLYYSSIFCFIIRSSWMLLVLSSYHFHIHHFLCKSIKTHASRKFLISEWAKFIICNCFQSASLVSFNLSPKLLTLLD